MSARRSSSETQTVELAEHLAAALERIKELEARVQVVEEKRMERAEATRMARVGRAAKRAGFADAKTWMKHCESVGWPDPTSQVPPDWKPKPRRRRRKK